MRLCSFSFVSCFFFPDSYPLSPDDLGPFTNASETTLQNFFNSMVRMEVNFTLYSVTLLENHPVQYKWSITVSPALANFVFFGLIVHIDDDRLFFQMKYNFAVRGGRIVVTLGIVKQSVANPGANTQHQTLLFD